MDKWESVCVRLIEHVLDIRSMAIELSEHSHRFAYQHMRTADTRTRIYSTYYRFQNIYKRYDDAAVVDVNISVRRLFSIRICHICRSFKYITLLIMLVIFFLQFLFALSSSLALCYSPILVYLALVRSLFLS